MLTSSPLTNYLSLVPFLVGFLLGLPKTTLAAPNLKAVILKNYEVAALNTDLSDNKPTVDIETYILENGPITWEQALTSLQFAKNAFAQSGVQLRIVGAQLFRIPHAWRKLAANTIPARGKSPDFYDRLEQQQTRLPRLTKMALEGIIKKSKSADRTLHIVVLDAVTMSTDNGNKIVSVTTGAYSFPPYFFLDALPVRIRGVISLQIADPKTLAHELGHKLLNVSHEWRQICPQFETHEGQGLMTYGEGVEIPAGLAGRWHQERLLKSPFIYRLENGNKIWNPDFKNKGRYRDAIYGGQFMTPACLN